MIWKRIVLTLLIITLLSSIEPTKALSQLKVDFPEGTLQRTGQLTLTTEVDQNIFAKKGFAILKVQIPKESSNLLKGGDVAYNIEDSNLQISVNFIRPVIQKLPFRFSIQLTDMNQQQYTFEQEEVKFIHPLQPKSDHIGKMEVIDPPLNQKRGQLILTAEIKPDNKFNSSGFANLEVRTTNGFSDLLRGGDVEYTITDSNLQAKANFIRHDVMDTDALIALLIKNHDEEEFAFFGKIHFNPLIPNPLQVLLPQEKKEKLTFTADVDPNVFNKKDSATLDVMQIIKGCPYFSRKENIEYVINGSTLQTQVDISEATELITLMLKLSVEGYSGGEYIFTTPVPYKLEHSKSAGLLWYHYTLLFIAGAICFYIWWRFRQRKPKVILPDHQDRQGAYSGENTYILRERIKCIVWRQTTFSIIWNIDKTDIPDKRQINVYYTTRQERHKILAPNGLTSIIVDPIDPTRPKWRFTLFPAKTEELLTLCFELLGPVELPFHQSFQYEICWKKGKNILKLGIRGFELILNQPIDNILFKKLEEKQEILERKFNDFSQTSEIIISHSNEIKKLQQSLNETDKKIELFGQSTGKIPGTTHEESRLLDIANEWWLNEKLDRKELKELIKKSSLPISLYAIKNINDNLTILTENTYTFEPSDDEGGWLWYQRLGEEYALAVPVDPIFFSNKLSGIMRIVSRMFSGFNANEIPDQIRFEKVYRACRLQALLGQSGKYKLVPGGRGHILLSGYSNTEFLLQQVKREDFLSLQSTLEKSNQQIAKNTNQIDKITGNIEQLTNRIEIIEHQKIQKRTTLDQRDKEQTIKTEIFDPKLFQTEYLRYNWEHKIFQQSKETITNKNNEQLPSGWEKAMETAFKKSEIDRDKVNGSDYYTTRLLDLKGTLQKYFEELRLPVLAKIVHLEIADNNFRLYSGEPRYEGNRWRFIRTSQQVALSGDLLFQLFIALGFNQQDFVWVLIPLGSFSDNKYPQGYKILLEEAPSENVQIVSVSRPAKLQVIYDDSDLYVVKQTMQFKYE